MQTCFFAISGILPGEQAISAIKESIRKTYGKKGTDIVQTNLNAVDHTLSHLIEVQIPDHLSRQPRVHPTPPNGQSVFVRDVLGRILAGHGDEVPVSAMPVREAQVAQPLFEFSGACALHVDSAAPKLAVEEYFNLENRFNMLRKSRPADAKRVFQEAQKQVDARWQLYQQLARSGSPDKENVKA